MEGRRETLDFPMLNWQKAKTGAQWRTKVETKCLSESSYLFDHTSLPCFRLNQIKSESASIFFRGWAAGRCAGSADGFCNGQLPPVCAPQPSLRAFSIC